MAAGILEAGIAATSAALAQAGNIAATNNLNRRNRRWQEAMWNKTNEYNEPVKQKERLEAAGINPYSVLAQGGADTGVTSMPDKPQQEVPSFEATANAGTNILGAINMAKQNELLDQQKEIGRVNVEFARMEKLAGMQKLYAEIGNLLEQKNLTHAEREMLERQYYILGESMNFIIEGRYYEAEKGRITSINLQREYDDSHNESVLHQKLLNWQIRLSKTKEKELFQGIKESIARIREINARTDLTRQEKLNLIDEIKTNERNRVSSRLHDRIDVNTFNKTLWKDINTMIDDATSIDVPFGRIKLPRPVVHSSDLKSLGIEY